jgi:putative CocE/NonD family hydrolase
MRIHALNLGNWYDIFSLATAENFRRMREEGPTEEIRKGQRLILGAGAHGAPARKLGERDFGENATIDLGTLERRWFDRWLKGVPNGAEADPPVKIFVMGANRWRDEDEWPPARARYVDWYLHSGGGANTLSGDGALGTAAPGDEKPDTFRYEPADPVPTTGGANLLLIPSGPFDQRKVEERRDILVYTSEPLKERLEVTGPIRLKLFAATSAADTDFTAKLVDVGPDGKAWNLADGIIRARWRESDTTPKPVEPGKVEEYLIDLWVTSNLFLEGHRIRLEVSSSNFPRFDRNPNTGKPFTVDGGFVVAEQTVHHSARHPSHLILPVVPEKKVGEGNLRRVDAPRPNRDLIGRAAGN